MVVHLYAKPLHAVALIYNKARFADDSKAEVLTNYQVNPFHLVQDRSVFDIGASAKPDCDI